MSTLTQQRKTIRFYLDNGCTIYKTLRIRMPDMPVNKAAKLLSVSESTLRRIENGLTMIDIPTLKSMDELYDCQGTLIDYHFDRVQLSETLIINKSKLVH